MSKEYRVVVLGGGSGGFSILRGLKKFSELLDISSIFTIADDGGSSGILRSEFGILPPGDFRRHIAALSESSKTMVDLLNFRFEDGSGVKDHSLGNLIYTALTKITGSDEGAILEMNKLFKTNESDVLPASLDKVRLVAEYENGFRLKGETNIDNLKTSNFGKINKIYLEPSAKAYPLAVEKIKNATHILICPGDLFTSILPILLVEGIGEAIRDSGAKIIYVMNLMTKVGETDNFSSEKFLEVINEYLKWKNVDCVILNKKVPGDEVLEKYRKEGSVLVGGSFDRFRFPEMKFIEADLIGESGVLRHDPKNTALEVIKYILTES